MRCPICGRPAQARFRPFCSGRCADVDLAHWLRGDYVLPPAEGEIGPGDNSDDDFRNLGVDTGGRGG